MTTTMSPDAATDRLDLPWAAPIPTFTYLGGAAGSGKTFLTKAWAEEDSGLLLTAVTGVAALNVGGSTINAVLGYFDTKSLQEQYVSGRLAAQLGRLWRAGVRRIILDEVSMLDADQLTVLVRAIEELNGRGYVLDRSTEDAPAEMGLTLVGDFCQLSPVKASYAFESPEWERFEPYTHTLTEIRRQANPEFIQALRAARRGDGKTAVEYFAPLLQDSTDDSFNGPTLFAKNESVDRFNQLRLDRLSSPLVQFPSQRWGKQRSEWGNPEKPPSTWGIPDQLAVKVGALVMILANQWSEGGPRSRRAIYINGDLGELVEANPASRIAVVRLQRTGAEVDVEYVTRQVQVPCDSARRKEIVARGDPERRLSQDRKWEILGEISYLPLRLAWASTCHKSQGLSLDRVQINLRDPFWKTSGMVYVGLSRARTAEGLRLVGSAASLVERCTVDPRLAAWL